MCVRERGKEILRVRGVYVLIQNTWQAQVTKTELVHERVCVWACLSTHIYVNFHLSGKTDRRTCGNVFGEMQAGFIGGGGGEPFSLGTLKNVSLLGYFSLAAAKLNDSNLATSPPIWQPHVQPCLCLFLMSNCNRLQIRAQPQLLHEAQILCDEHAFKDKLTHSTKCVPC